MINPHGATLGALITIAQILFIYLATEKPMAQRLPTLPTPPDIFNWLMQNQQFTPHSLINELIKAGHPSFNALVWVSQFFGEGMQLALDQIPGDVARDMLRYCGDQKTADQITAGLGLEPVKVIQMNFGSDANEPVRHFRPSGTFGERFPNFLQSSDLGLHPVAVHKENPRILHVLNVLTAEECDQLVEASKPTLIRSKVVSTVGGDDLEDSSRTSYGTHFDKGKNELADRIQRRLAEIFHYPFSNAESLQILNYGTGGEYKPHFDFFMNDPGGLHHIGNGGNRVATIVMYLNEVEKGGATGFPNCQTRVMPIKGSVVYFDYLLDNNRLDELTLHAGEPVETGHKWIATQWVREYPWF